MFTGTTRLQLFLLVLLNAPILQKGLKAMSSLLILGLLAFVFVVSVRLGFTMREVCDWIVKALRRRL